MSSWADLYLGDQKIRQKDLLSSVSTSKIPTDTKRWAWNSCFRRFIPRRCLWIPYGCPKCEGRHSNRHSVHRCTPISFRPEEKSEQWWRNCPVDPWTVLQLLQLDGSHQGASLPAGCWKAIQTDGRAHLQRSHSERRADRPARIITVLPMIVAISLIDHTWHYKTWGSRGKKGSFLPPSLPTMTPVLHSWLESTFLVHYVLVDHSSIFLHFFIDALDHLCH